MNPKIEVSEFSDCCFGVRRAVWLAEKALEKSPKPVFSLGPLIHNRQVVERLSGKGLNVRKNLGNIKEGTVVIRSHGVSPEVLSEINRKKLGLVDATCPFVKNAQNLARDLSRKGYSVVIVGDKGHPEVKALKSLSGGRAFVVADKNDARKVRFKKEKIGIIAQTTQSPRNFLEVVSELLVKGSSEIRVFNTICRDTNMRQEATKRYSKSSEVVFVVGGKDSANTRRLYEICRHMGTRAYHIEDPSELKKRWFKGKKAIGVVSGASTPRWVVDEVVDRLKRKEG